MKKNTIKIQKIINQLFEKAYINLYLNVKKRKQINKITLTYNYKNKKQKKIYKNKYKIIKII